MAKISVVTPSVRPEGLDMVEKCLKRQTFKGFEWIVVSPFVPFATNENAIESQINRARLQGYAVLSHTLSGSSSRWIPEPEKKEGDFYNLNKAWNAAIKHASGELMVSIVDLLWFPPDILDNLWAHYILDPMSCIGGIGHQYNRIENGKPEGKVWNDPRERKEQYYQIPPIDYELCLASLPLKGVRDVGGFEEKFDFYAALSEKELCLRMEKLGYTFWLDQTLAYRALQHPRLTKDWDERYQQGIYYFNECVESIKKGNRLVLPYLTNNKKVV